MKSWYFASRLAPRQKCHKPKNLSLQILEYSYDSALRSPKAEYPAPIMTTRSVIFGQITIPRDNDYYNLKSHREKSPQDIFDTMKKKSTQNAIYTERHTHTNPSSGTPSHLPQSQLKTTQQMKDLKANKKLPFSISKNEKRETEIPYQTESRHSKVESKVKLGGGGPTKYKNVTSRIDCWQNT